MGMRSLGKEVARWSPGEIGRLGGFFTGPLALDTGKGMVEPRHAIFSDEKMLLCWDAVDRSIVRVSDWERSEYWGERVLAVEGLAPMAIGLSWCRRQSDLWELGEPWQGVEARLELARLGDEAKAGLCLHLAGLWRSMREEREMSDAAPLKAGEALDTSGSGQPPARRPAL